MRAPYYLKEASRYWLLLGTIMLMFGSIGEFQLSFTYLLAVLIVWGLTVGIPSFILLKVGRWLEKRSQSSPDPDEKKEPSTGNS